MARSRQSLDHCFWSPAFFERDISFFMGVTASAGWPAGVYRGVVVEGKGELKI
jgi:hypothetical protein